MQAAREAPLAALSALALPFHFAEVGVGRGAEELAHKEVLNAIRLAKLAQIAYEEG